VLAAALHHLQNLKKESRIAFEKKKEASFSVHDRDPLIHLNIQLKSQY